MRCPESSEGKHSQIPLWKRGSCWLDIILFQWGILFANKVFIREGIILQITMSHQNPGMLGNAFTHSTVRRLWIKTATKWHTLVLFHCSQLTSKPQSHSLSLFRLELMKWPWWMSLSTRRFLLNGRLRTLIVIGWKLLYETHTPVTTLQFTVSVNAPAISEHDSLCCLATISLSPGTT